MPNLVNEVPDASAFQAPQKLVSPAYPVTLASGKACSIWLIR